VLKYLRGELAGAAEGEVSFNYLGQLDQVLAADGLLAEAAESAGKLRHDHGERRYKVEVEASVLGSRLQVSWSYSGEQVEAAEMERVAGWYMEELREIIRHCAEPAAGGYTPSDVVEFAWNQQELDEIVTQISGSMK
jgi:non-ribosomal peptide synthase protein (TIGR01720 family)